MRDLVRWPTIVLVSVILLIVNTSSYGDDDVFGIQIEQRALDLLGLVSQRMIEALGTPDLEQVISIKAKIIVADLMEPEGIMELTPEMVLQTRIEIFKAGPDSVRVNLTSNLVDLQFLVAGPESLAALPESGVFARMNIPQMIPERLMLQGDGGGLFTLINLLGGVPLGMLFHPTPAHGDGGGPDIQFGDVDPSDMHAVIRYWGKDKVDAGVVHVVTILAVGAAPYHQGIKIWVLEDTLELYQISIEDERGTEVFLVIEELDTSPVHSPESFTMDTSGMAEISKADFVQMFMLSVATSPAVEGPVAVDLSASSDRVARTGALTISTNGFDMEDNEDELTLEAEYRGPGGSWEPLQAIEYSGLTPLGHWNAIFAPSDTAEAGMYSFRVRYTDSSGNASEWLEALDMVTVTPAPPRVVRTSPLKGETGVPISTRITVTFSKPMDKHTVEENFSVSAGFKKEVQGSFSWDGNTLIFSPQEDLRYDANHLVMVTGEAKDTDGIGLDGNYDGSPDGTPYDDYLWTFRTSPARPTLALAPADRGVYTGDRFDVRIMAKYVTGMHRFSLNLAFDPEVLEVEKVDMASFSSWRPRPKYIEAGDICGEPVVDESSGSVVIACDSTRQGGVSGSGYIATISFRAIGTGTVLLGFRDVSMFDSQDRPIEVELRTAEIRAMEFHPLDVNHDGVVNILDFAEMASGEDANSQAAPCVTENGAGQNFPNPFNPETWIPYQLAQPSHVTVRIYRATGELVRTLDMGFKEAGRYTDRTRAAHWDGMDETGQRVSSGVYFYNIQADGFSATRKMLLRN